MPVTTGTDTGTSSETSTPADSGVDGPSPDAPPAETGPTVCVTDPGPGDAGIPPSSGGTDPVGSADKFTLAQALAGFPAGTGALIAHITTEKGEIRCTFDETKAPTTVANFIGLARGTRPYQDKTGAWVTGKFYDGLIWHRVILDFVIQGGDPKGTGTGGPGYSLPNENHVAEPLGTLAMAASTEPSGSQFYIVVGTGPAANYNVFGTCSTDVAIAIAGVDRTASDKPKVPVHMSIVIDRCAK